MGKYMKLMFVTKCLDHTILTEGLLLECTLVSRSFWIISVPCIVYIMSSALPCLPSMFAMKAMISGVACNALNGKIKCTE
jgi:hypothetical protein